MVKTTTQVVNLRNSQYDVYIGRAGRGQTGKWGNPYEIGKDGTREQVIAKYETYIRSNPALMQTLVPELAGKSLGCFCKPQACHGDVLVKLIEEQQQQQMQGKRRKAS